MNKIKLMTLTIVLASSFTQAASHNKLKFIDQYDSNHDWSLSLNEFNDTRQSRFMKTDENNDGFVDESEYVFEYKNKLDEQLAKDRQGSVKQTISRFHALDKNKNNRIDLEEYQTSATRTFEYFDTNKDKVIDAQDSKLRKKKENKKVLSQAEKQEKQIKNLPYAKRILRMPTTHDFKGMLIKYDANDDNIITSEEIENVRKITWDLADENKDGWLSEQEYLYEFEDRLDAQMNKTRKRAVKQTYVRFRILDKDKNEKMTLDEYQLSGHRSFNRFDTDNNNIVTLAEPLPKKREKNKKAEKANKKSY